MAPRGEVKHTMWAEAHKDVIEKLVDKEKSGNEGRGC